MIKIGRKRLEKLDDTVIYRMVPELNTRDVLGYSESWYSGGHFGFPGIKIDDKDKLEYAHIVAKGQGLYLGEMGFSGIVKHGLFYDEQSFLVNGVVLTNSLRREYFRKGKPEISDLKVSREMPKQIITLLSEKSERILETAEMLKLPLQELVPS